MKKWNNPFFSKSIARFFFASICLISVTEKKQMEKIMVSEKHFSEKKSILLSFQIN